MVVIVNIGIIKFLPIMNIAMRQPAARDSFRGLMRNRAGTSPCAGVRQYQFWRRSISDFGGYRAWAKRPWTDSFTASSCPRCSSRPSFSSGTYWARG